MCLGYVMSALSRGANQGVTEKLLSMYNYNHDYS